MSKVRGLSRAELNALGIDSRSPTQKAVQAVRGKPLSGAVAAPAFEVSANFDLQSYFDSTLLEKAIFRQPPNQQIVPSTMSDEIQTAGYGLALHPSSETPVAVQFLTGAQQGASKTYSLKPGQVLRPQGVGIDKEGVQQDGFFTGFVWGLPFGWLGGGAATIVVLRSPDSSVLWGNDHAELTYHRTRLQIVAPATLPVSAGAYSGPLNWPTRFPWPFAQFGASSLTQRGQPALAVSPSRTALSLRLSTVVVGAAPSDGTMRMYWVGADDWAQSGPTANNGPATISLSDIRATDQVWGTWAQEAGAPAPFNSAFQSLMLTGEAAVYAANAGALALASVDPQLQGAFVDIVRYGYL